MSGLSGGRMHMPDEQPSGIGEANRRKQQTQQPRQLLSCTKCRERKVKCDRTKPCSACCARGAPKDCHFVAEGGDYAPIQQSYELRKLRAENLRLKERLRACKIPIEDEESDPVASPDSQLGERPTSSQRRRTAKQKRFQGSEWQDSIYFGSPGLASVIHDFASINIDPSVNLAHVVPRGSDMYAPRNPPPYPFATLFKATPEECIPQLLSCLPSREELLEYLQTFEKRVKVCSFPHVPVEITGSEVERFLSDDRKNAQMCPDMLALLFAAIALGAQYSAWDKAGGKWVADVINAEMGKGDVYIAAAMQALRLASFMHKPSLLSIQALIMIGPYLTNSGRFLDAWTLFGLTIRLAHSIGLHRHPKYLDPSPPTQRECSMRQTLWWWMLHMDEQYSMTLGRPLGISGIGDCPWPHELTTDPTILRFGEFVNHFTVLARHILSSDRSTNAKLDDFTDALRALLDTMPETLQFDESWIRDETDIPDWPLRVMAAVYYCKTHTYLILLNRQRMEKNAMSAYSSNAKGSTQPVRAANHTSSSHPSPAPSTPSSVRGRAAVLSSSEDVLSAFMFFYYKQPAALIDWTLGQQAFNSCMILLFAAIEIGEVTRGAMKVERAFVVFKELQDNEVHKLATLAVERISWGLTELHKIDFRARTSGVTARGHQRGDSAMQGRQSEATHGSSASDTVMGNTGMSLLEDPGLQAFVHEAFTPIRWAAPAPSTAFTRDQEHNLPHGARERGPFRTEIPRRDFQHVRSAVEMQGTRKSPTIGSAPTRYATPLDDDPRPHGFTAPTSPTTLVIPHLTRPSLSSRVQHEAQLFEEHQDWSPPHSLHDQAPTTASQPRKNRDRHQDADLRAPGRLQQYQGVHLTSAAPHQAPNVQSRHNSCPSLPQYTSDPPLLRPTHSSPSNVTRLTAMQSVGNVPSEVRLPASIAEEASFHTLLDIAPHPTATIGNPRVHPSFAARSLTGIPEVAPSFASISNHDQSHSGLPQDMLQRHQSTGHGLSDHYPNAPPSTMTHSTEDARLDEWRRYVGSSGPG